MIKLFVCLLFATIALSCPDEETPGPGPSGAEGLELNQIPEAYRQYATVYEGDKIIGQIIADPQYYYYDASLWVPPVSDSPTMLLPVPTYPMYSEFSRVVCLRADPNNSTRMIVASYRAELFDQCTPPDAPCYVFDGQVRSPDDLPEGMYRIYPGIILPVNYTAPAPVPVELEGIPSLYHPYLLQDYTNKVIGQYVSTNETATRIEMLNCMTGLGIGVTVNISTEIPVYENYTKPAFIIVDPQYPSYIYYIQTRVIEIVLDLACGQLSVMAGYVDCPRDVPMGTYNVYAVKLEA